MKCAFWAFVAKNESVPDTHKLSRVRCKQWSCDYCSKRLKARWQAHLQSEIARLGGSWSLLTITADGKDHRAKNTIVALRLHMDTLQKRLKRLWGRFEYIRFYEQHQSGEYHVHMLAQVYPPDSDSERVRRYNRKTKQYDEYYNGRYWLDLSEASEAVGLGFICDVKPLGAVCEVGFPLIVSYVTKYLTKQSQGYEAPKGLRRIQPSRGFRPMNDHDEIDSGWFIDNGGYTKEEFISRDNKGIAVVDLDRNKRLVLADYKHELTYPNKSYDRRHEVNKNKLDSE